KRWWDQRLRQLIDAVGREAVAQNLFVAEHFPYHTKKAYSAPVPSQLYTFFLVERAVKRRALVVFFRSRKLWENSVTGSIGYSRALAVANHQWPYISRGNLPGGTFEEVVRSTRAT